jgi:ATP-dependent helicase/nuclease subunit A
MSAAFQINGRAVPVAEFYARACDPQRSVAVEACAGAGKTWMLIARIVRALLEGCEPQDILAITFTKKAAADMRKRLGEALAEFEDMDEAQALQALKDRGVPESQASAWVQPVRELAAQVLTNGRPVQVRTFHSWFGALLRNAPVSVVQALKLPLQYELLEDDGKAIPLLLPLFYSELKTDANAHEDFAQTVALFGRSSTEKALIEALRKRVEFSLADAQGVVDTSVQTFAQRYPHLASWPAPEASLSTVAARARWLVWAQALGAEENATPRKAADAIVKAFELGENPSEQAQRLAQLRKALFIQKEDRLSKNLEKFDAAKAAESELAECWRAHQQHQAWSHHQRMARLTRILLKTYRLLKHERAWVDMNDIEGAAQRLLSDAELSGWLQQRLDARVRHLLIDEFQDTNPLQWQALYGWLSAYVGAGSGEAPSVFLVGDPKQSIYRFRRAEPQVFLAAQDFVVKGLGGDVLSCDHTRRCAPAVLSLLNNAMAQAVQAGEYGAHFRAHTTQSTVEGAVLRLPVVERGPKTVAGETPADWRDSLSTPLRALEDTIKAQEARQAARWLRQRIDAGELSADGVMVLSRKRERLGLMHEALRDVGLASEQPEQRELKDAPAVQDVVALLDVLVSPHHDASLAQALKSPLFAWADAELARLAEQQRRSPDSTWWDLLQTQAVFWSCADVAERLIRYQGWVLQWPPHDALSAIFEDLQVLQRYAQAVAPRLRAATESSLRDVLAQSLAQDRGRFLSMYRLVRALKAEGNKATPSHTPGAIRLLTIHGAKGLEADTVLLLDTDALPSKPATMAVLVDWPGENPTPSRFVFLAREQAPPECAQTLMDQEQAARAVEELNALYVAVTRAETRLVLSCVEPHQTQSHTSWWQRLSDGATPVEVADMDSTVAALPKSVQGWAVPTVDVSVLTAWADRAQARQARHGEPLSDDLRARLGSAMHRLLEWRPTPAAGFDWSDAQRQAVAREFELDAAQADEALRMARGVCQGEAAWVWDAQRVSQWFNEVPVNHAGQTLRIDRLVRERDSGQWWVLDYKSAHSPQTQTALLDQMQGYAQALRAVPEIGTVRLAFINPQGAFLEVPVQVARP